MGNMEGEHSMEGGHSTDRQWEEQYLTQTLQIVERNLEHYSQETKRMQAEIDVMLEHYHDNDVELWTLLNNTITLNEHMKMAMKRNEKAKEKPYFGRIIFRDETLGVVESLYIGKGGISKDSTHQVVVDWRAPVANTYYENGLGKCSYQAPDGKELPIDLKLKRTYEITDGKLTEYFDTEVVANDDLLTKYLSKNKQAVLGEIVATIQKEQNEIIRKSPYHNIIVQGVAGSGKTTVAMHRISFILYNYQERFRPEDFYIVGSNRILLNYITGVLPDLDVHGVRQMTMEQLFIRLLYEDWDEKKYHVRPIAGANEAVKGTEGWYRELTGFIRRLERESISLESVYLNPRQFVEGLRDGKSGVYDMTEEDSKGQGGNMTLHYGQNPNHAWNPQGSQAQRNTQLIELVSGDAVARYVSQNPNISIQSKINMLNERLLIKVRDEFTGKGIKYTEPERKAILKAYRGRYGGKEWKKSIFSIYREFLKEQQDKGYKIQIPSDSFDVYDLAALALIYKLVKETEVISEAHHIVIDEAQDFGMFAYRVLHTCIKDCTYTIMGDVSQNIHFGYGLRDWEELRSLMLADSQDSFGVLKKSYRNTVEISNFATNILRHGSFSIYPVEPIIRHGAEVTVEEVKSSVDSSLETPDFVGCAADICRDWQQKGYDTIAVVCRDGESAEGAASALSRHIDIMESDLEKADFGSGIMVLPVEYTKGLEFDAVLIWDPTREDYPVDDGHARLLYVAATRALHELCVLHSGNLTGLIADPVPDETVMSDAGENSWYSETSQQKEALQNNEVSQQKETPHHNGVSQQKETPHHNGALQKDKKSHKKVVAVLSSSQRSAPRSGNPAFREPAIKNPAFREPAVKNPAFGEQPGQNNTLYHFGDMPATEKLRPAGHSKINLSVKWCARQEDGLYLPSQYGTLRICPVGSGIVRITFAKGAKITEGRHPLIAADRVEKNWKYRDTGKVIEVSMGELLLQVDKSSGAICYMTPEKKLLLAERKQECRLIDNLPLIDDLPQVEAFAKINNLSQNGALVQTKGSRSWLFLDWQKGEQLFALGPEGQPALSLKGTARIISYRKMSGEEALPFLLSDKGYGLLPAATGTAFSCNIPAYGSYLCMETAGGQMDYYVIAGKQQRTIMGAYAYLCGLL